MIRRTVKNVFSGEKTFRQKANAVFAIINFVLKRTIVRSYPIKLTIDPCNSCNLHCKLCPVGTQDPSRKRGKMSFEAFKDIIDECGPYLMDIDLYNWGEPLLNKDLFEMIEYARKLRINVSVSTNLNYWNKEICENIVKSRLNNLIISLDGASQESVEKYQEGSSFNDVIENIKEIINRRESANTKLPKIIWMFIVTKYNEHEITVARKIAKSLKIDKFQPGFLRTNMSKEIFQNNATQFKSIQEWLPKDENLSMYDYKNRKKKTIKSTCRLLWLESVIHPNGAVSPCCALWNEEYDFGNIHKSNSFMEIWNNAHYQNARKIVANKNTTAVENICSICKKNKAII